MKKNVNIASGPPEFDKHYRLWLLLTQTRSAIFKVRHKVIGQYLHPNQAAALVSIWAMEGQITPAVLSRRLFLEPHSVSELIMRMQKKGLVSKKKDKKRGNVVRISMTEKGKEMCRHVMGRELIARVMSVLTDEQLEQLKTSLTILMMEALKELGMEEDITLFPIEMD
jgi:MarR family transcriptional regulator, organic hydroperoxide resistance regulator